MPCATRWGWQQCEGGRVTGLLGRTHRGAGAAGQSVCGCGGLRAGASAGTIQLGAAGQRGLQGQQPAGCSIQHRADVFCCHRGGLLGAVLHREGHLFPWVCCGLTGRRPRLGLA